MATLRTISQTGKEANWKKDKQVKLSSLEDFQFFTFNDIDFMDRDRKIIGSFENFRTDDILQIGGIISMSRDDDDEWEPGTENRIRVYYEPVGADWSTEVYNPTITDAIIESKELFISIYKHNDFNSAFPGYNPETLAKIEYPIYDIGYKHVATISRYIDNAVVYTSGSDEVQFVGTEANPREQWLASQAYGRNLFLVPDEQNYIPEDTYLTSVVSETELTQTYKMSETAVGTGAMATTITDNNWVKKHYVILMNHLDDERGIEWSDEFENVVPSSYKWQVLQDSPYDDDVTINDARFLKKDPQFRGEE